jgi:GH25 family lysozyme M1 (1,4-beta-N-acetylmuramidase)
VTELVDLAHWQSPVDFAALKAAGIVGVICKATQGGGYVDPTFADKAAAARKAGVLFGAYHFADPDSAAGDPEAEADHFLAVARAVPWDLRPALDLERSALPASVTDDWALAWLERVEFHTGIAPLVYTGPSWAAAHVEPNPALAQFPLWVAHWTTHPTPDLPRPWTSWVLWQYGGSTVPGIAGNVDRDRCPTVTPLLYAQPTPPPPPIGKAIMQVLISPTHVGATDPHSPNNFLYYLLGGPDDGKPGADWREIPATQGILLASQGVPIHDFSKNPNVLGVTWASLVAPGAALGPARPLPR